MRKLIINNGITVNAVAGCHVVLLGLDIEQKLRAGLRGFAIRRKDPAEEEVYWMKGMKTFEAVEPHPAPGEQFSSFEHPFQSFQWADYSAKPGRTYTYEVCAMYGTPGSLTQKASASVTIKTEPVYGDVHSVFFNRGAVATQEYARRFQNLVPRKAGAGAYEWLSRGLLESIIEFIKRAKDKSWGLKGAFYEFQWPAVLDELRDAKARGVEVEIVFDDIDSGKGPKHKNEEAIADAKIKSVCKPRQNGKIMHNKFLVLTNKGKPQSVLFGSTNLTENGIFGHANCVHIIENPEVAEKYLEYQRILRGDPETSSRKSSYKSSNDKMSPAPAPLKKGSPLPVFSPRASLSALDWYASIAGSANKALFMTFAFGMNDAFRAVYSKKDSKLRMALMEKEWNGANKVAQIAKVRALQKLSNVVIAVGNRIPLNGFDRWLGGLDRINGNVIVKWVHTKFMVVDPLSDDPTVITGSANFSKASIDTNDENMLIIRGDKRVADIYFTEFFRLHSHYAFRQAVGIFLERNAGKKPEDFRQGFLEDKGDWTASYFKQNDKNARYIRRLYYSGQ